MKILQEACAIQANFDRWSRMNATKGRIRESSPRLCRLRAAKTRFPSQTLRYTSARMKRTGFLARPEGGEDRR